MRPLQKSKFTSILFKGGFRSAVRLFIHIKSNNLKGHTAFITHRSGGCSSYAISVEVFTIREPSVLQ